MKMVAAAKLNRVEGTLKTFRAYSDEFNRVAGEMLGGLENISHPFLEEKPEKRVHIVAIASDRGLCGSYNHNILNLIEKHWKDLKARGVEVDFTAVGKRSADFIKKRAGNVIESFVGSIDRELLNIENALVEIVSGRFLSGEADAVYAAYTRFVSPVSQIPQWQRLLPAPFKTEESYRVVPIIEPSTQRVVDRIMTEYLRVSIRRTLMEAITSEHAARMTAMDNATNNAEDLINRLTLLYNKERQASITRELLDITNGKEAIEFG